MYRTQLTHCSVQLPLAVLDVGIKSDVNSSANDGWKGKKGSWGLLCELMFNDLTWLLRRVPVQRVSENTFKTHFKGL